MTDLPDRARAAYQTQTFPEFVRSVLSFGKGVALDLLPHRLRMRLFYRECRFRSELGDISLAVPRNSYYTERAPKTYEPQLVDCLTNCLDQESVFYDIGSYFGYYVSVALLSGVPPSQIHAFDGDSFHAYVFRQNCLDDVHRNRVFVGETTDSTTTTIDEYASRTVPPDVIKIDIEGMELQALRGASSVLEHSHPTLFVEAHPFSSRYDETDLVQYLRTAGYTLGVAYHQIERIDERRSVMQLPKDANPRSYLARNGLEADDDPYLLVAVPETREVNLFDSSSV